MLGAISQTPIHIPLGSFRHTLGTTFLLYQFSLYCRHYRVTRSHHISRCPFHLQDCGRSFWVAVRSDDIPGGDRRRHLIDIVHRETSLLYGSLHSDLMPTSLNSDHADLTSGRRHELVYTETNDSVESYTRYSRCDWMVNSMETIGSCRD